MDQEVIESSLPDEEDDLSMPELEEQGDDDSDG
jgi:hypothetical protein